MTSIRHTKVVGFLKHLFARYACSSFMNAVATARVRNKLLDIIPCVPAYVDFLKKNSVDTSALKSLNITDLPITDKSSYIQNYSIPDLCLGGTLTDKYCLESSSGYSGEEQFWARNEIEDISFTQYLEISCKNFLNVNKKSTLVIVCWSLGTWVTGEKFAHAARNIAKKKNYHMSVVTPGNNFKTVVNIIKKFQGKYDQIVLAGYPFFLKNLLLKGAPAGIDWTASKFHIIAGGEGFPEDMRDFFADHLCSPVNTVDGSIIASAFGSADTGIGVGHETPLTIMIRRLAKANADLANALFGSAVHNLPMVFQYNPLNYYIETYKDHVLVTAPFNGMPLIRYNLHDNGGVIQFDVAKKIFSKFGIDLFDKFDELGFAKTHFWKLPILYIFGRSDGTIIFNGANIYLENIKEALALPEIVHTNTGKFQMSRILLDNFEPRIQITVELTKGTQATENLRTIYEAGIVATLSRVNKEYKDQLSKVQEKALPIIEFVDQDPDQHNPTIKHKYL